MSRKKESALLLLFIISKSPGGYAIYARVLEMKNFTLAYMKGWTYGRTRTDDFLKTKMSWMHRQPNFLTHGAPLQ